MTITTLRIRIALCLSALAAAVALAAIAAPANASAATNVQLRSDFLTTYNNPDPMMAVNPATAATFMAAPNAADSRQRWARENAGGGVYRFRSPAFQSCLKVADSTATQSNAPVVLGNCASPRAQWRQLTVNGAPRVLINAVTGHAMAPPLCIDGGPCDTRVQLVPAKDVPTLSLLLGWSMLPV
jgi:hypothetical protein